MIHPVPPGTRDVLPDEMRELRALSTSLHGSFEAAGYGEVWTPALEYEDVLRRGDDRVAGAGFRLFDGRGQAREFLQGGIELIGVGGPEGDAEVIALLAEALSAAGLRRHRIGLGDGMLYRGLLAGAGVADDASEPLLEALWRRDLVALERRAAELDVDEGDRRRLIEVPSLRGGPEVLTRIEGPAAQNLRAVHAL